MNSRPAAIAYTLLVLVSAAYCVLRFASGTPVESDLLALLPATEKHPLAERAVAVVARQGGERAVFLLSAPRFSEAAAAARRLGAQLGAQPRAFREVRLEFAADPGALIETYRPHRGQLLLPEDARAITIEPRATLEERLAERLHAPMSFGPRTAIADDPFGFLQRYLARLPLTSGKLSLREGMLTREADGQSHVLLFAEPAGSPYETGVQDAVDSAVMHAKAMLESEFPRVTLAYTGPVFFGAAARRQAEQEMNRIGGIGLAAVLLLLAGVFRSWRHLWVGLLPIVAGLTVASAFCLAFYGRLHVLTLGCGASLIGVAVDYVFHYFALQLDQGKSWNADLAWRELWPTLRLGVLTTLGGYALLWLMPFPGLRQMALFSLLGITAAAVAVWAWLPRLLPQPLLRDTSALMVWPARVLATSQRVLSGRRVLLLAAAGGMLATPGWMALSAKDDIRLLVAPPAALVEVEAQLRRLAGWGGGSQFFLVEGQDEAQLAERERALQASLQRLQESGGVTGFTSIADFVPAPAEQLAAREALARVWQSGEIEGVLRRAGFGEDIIERERVQFAHSTPLTRAEWLDSPIASQHRALALAPGASLVLPQGQTSAAVLREASAGLAGVSLIDKPGSVSELFRDYRRFATWALLAAFPLAVLLLSQRYGWRGAAIVSAPAAAAMLFSLSLLGWGGEALTLFHLLGLFLVFGIGMDYSIFLFEDGGRRPAVFLGVVLAAATTLLSFGLLAWSSMPALRGFGLTLFLGVGISVLCAPAVLVWKRPQAERI